MANKILFDGFHKIEEIVSNVNGKKMVREKLVLLNAVAGIVVDENSRIALVNQYRPSAGKYTKEIPAGVLDKPELTAKETLIEELFEECGIGKGDIISISPPVHNYHSIIGHSDAQIALHKVLVRKQKNRVVNDKDVDSVEWVSFNQLKEWVDKGNITDGKTLLAYYILGEQKSV